MRFDWIGWFATALFMASYFCKNPVTLRRVQGLAALAWAAYGVVIHAWPVIVANVLVTGVALWTSLARTAAVVPTSTPPSAGPPGARATGYT
jgi:Trk-type K+ transport system membrane component